MILFRNILVLLLSFVMRAQVVVSYDYDAMGNRIKREIVLSRSMENTEKPLTETLSRKSISIYPNPTAGLLKISISGWETTDKCKFTIFSLKGALNQEIQVCIKGTSSYSTKTTRI